MQIEKQNRVETILNNGEKKARRFLPSVQANDARLEQLEKGTVMADRLKDTTQEERKSAQKGKAEMARRMRPSRFYILERAFAGTNNVFGKFFHAMFKAIREYREQNRRQEPGKAITSRKEKLPGKKQPAKKEKEIRFSRSSSKDVLKHLERTVQKLGWGNKIPPEAQIALLANDPTFRLSKSTGIGPDEIKRTIQFEQSAFSGRYYPVEGQATLRKYVHLDGAGIKEVNVPELDKKMRSINWQHDFMQPGVKVSNDPVENKRMLARVNGIFKDLFLLKTSADPKANAVHDRLAYKYLADTPSGGVIQNMPALKEMYESTVTYDLRTPNAIHFTDVQLHALLKGNAVKPENAREWYQANNIKENAASQLVQPVGKSETFQLDAALHRAGAGELISSKQFAVLKRDLENGKPIKAQVTQNGVTADRMIRANPAGGTITIDWEESQKNRLIEPSLKQIDHFHKYHAHHAGLKEKENKSRVVNLDPDYSQSSGHNHTPRRS